MSVKQEKNDLAYIADSILEVEWTHEQKIKCEIVFESGNKYIWDSKKRKFIKHD